ncbi:MAG: nitroreductase family protein [Patiriisocius sp.]|uniref:nitroreductase family protein n=1 Tax=Patiriisocius sp. TaxID=2822396 RepID=UPI003EF57380
MIQDLIKTRRSVFPDQYNDQLITKEELNQILEAANWAPTHKRTEPWRFKVVQGTSKLALGDFLAETLKKTSPRFSEFKYKKIKEKCEKSSAVIVICLERDAQERIPEWEEVAATAMAVQNMWLVAHSLKIGAYWSSPGMIKYMGEFFDFKENELCLGFFYMGKYDGELEPGNRNSAIDEKTVWLQ